MNSMKEYALYYASLGLAVFPIRPKGKEPLTAHGFQDATRDTEQIKAWWTQWPSANIGIATGSRSGGLLVIDLDVDEDKGVDGRETLREWEAEHGKLPGNTWLSITGRGGYHYFYRTAEKIRNRTALYEGVDIRGEGGYVVAPPSDHPNGRSYQWEQGPEDGPLAEADGKVMEFVSGRSLEKLGRGFEVPEQIPEGERTNTLVRLLCSQQAKGLSDEAIRAAVRAENEAKCVPPLTDEELEKTVFPALGRYQKGTAPYGAKYGSRSEAFVTFVPFATPSACELLLFPCESLPPVLMAYSRQIEESLQVVNEMVSPTLLGAVSMCIQGEYCISPKADWKEPLNLYVLTVNKPSERKTPVFKEILKPIYEYQDRINTDRRPLIIKYQMKKNILQKKIESSLRAIGAKATKGAKAQAQAVFEDEIITMQNELVELEENAVGPITLLADDVTTEALVKLMNENNDRIAIASAEGGIFGMMAGRYSTQPNIDIFLKGYSGEAYTSHRVSGRVETLKEPLITMILMVQPTVLMEALGNREFRERGLMARFLYSMPDSKIGKRRYRTMAIDENVRKAFYDLLNELLECREWEHPKTIYLSDEADKLGEEFYNEIETTLFSEYEEMGDWIGKLYGQTMRIAGILHIVKYRLGAAEVRVEAETMRNAISIGRYYLEHAKAVFIASGAYDPPEVKNAKYILKRIDSTGEARLSKREVFRLCQHKAGFETTESIAFTSGMDELWRRGYIKIDRDKSTGGRPTETVVLNPQYLAQRGKVK